MRWRRDRRNRRLGLGLLGGMVAGVLLAAPSGAGAATFYVDDDSGATPTPCTNPPPFSGCQTINDALTQSRDPGFAGPDLIMVAAGNYSESVDFDDPDDAGTILDGAGTNTGGSGTVIAHPASEGTAVRENNVTVRDVALLGSGATTLFIGNPTPPGPTGTVIENVLVRNDQPNTLPGIRVNTSNDTILNEVMVEGDSDWSGATAYGVLTNNSQDVLINDSVVTSNEGGVFSRLSDLTITRSVVRGPTDSSAPGIEVVAESSVAASLMLDSSLVFLGDPGLSVTDNGGSPGFANATVRNSTIDAGAPKGSDGTAIAAEADFASDDASVTFNSSIGVGGITLTGAGTGSIICRHSDVPDTEQPVPRRISCGTDPGNLSGNSTTPASQLFEPGFLGLDWHLLPDSPAIDTGDPAALPPDQSTTDLDGNPRVVNGNCDAITQRDKGAYERPAPLCPPPPPPPPDSGSGGGAGGGTGGAFIAQAPSNLFEVGKLVKNKKKGIAFLFVSVPGPGQLGLEGKGVKQVSLARAEARKSLAVSGGVVKLKVKPGKGKKARKVVRQLKNKGKAKLKVRVTFIPTGGTANTKVRKVKLVRK